VASTDKNNQGQMAKQPQVFRNYNFKLLLEGQSGGHFTHCSGMGVRIENIPYREGGAGQIVHQLAGPVSYSPVTLRYGITDSPTMWQWLNPAMRGMPTRRNVSIIMLQPDGKDGVRWDLNAAWPIEWRGAPLDALGKEVAVDTLVLVYEELNRG